MNGADGTSRPGIVDQDVHRAVDLQGLFDQVVHLTLIGDICRDGEGILSQGSQLFGHVVDFFFAPGRKDDLRSLSAEGQGHRATQTSSRTRDDRHFVFQFHKDTN